ncbi:CesT family type III secretion system chaperone [uncultured Succinivibrio sp.]|uniref:type III secretion system chaperone n=1 Tax=uncultured Succinivibrio sp. TaxID=540749 RepID=UPI0025F9C103|nr:CesT family type III secretion system chaperone [uncultured Succinivibrio sp.]
MFADIGVAKDIRFVFKRILSANYLGNETGQGVISINENDGNFVLHRLIDGDVPYSDFEKILVMFVRAVRYWKEWLSLSREEQQESKFENVNNPLTMLSTIV